MEALLSAQTVNGFPSLILNSIVHCSESQIFSSNSVAGLKGNYSRCISTELRATGPNGKRGGIGSGRRRRGTPRIDKMRAETETTLPFLEPLLRTHREEGHQILGDVEYLLLRATNPFGLVLEISEEANEYLLNKREETLLRKPVLKIISDRINESTGEQLRDCYIDDHPDSEKYET